MLFNDKLRKFNTGFTLTEVLLVMAILGVISVTAAKFMMDYFDVNDSLSVHMALQTQGRNAINQIINDSRRINQSNLGASAIESASATSFIFYSNIDSDPYFEKVEYTLTGTELSKGVIKPDGNPLVYNSLNKVTTVLSDKIANGATPVFSYYDNTYAGTGDPLVLSGDFSAIRFVKVNLILDDKPLAPTASLDMEANVALRNLKDN